MNTIRQAVKPSIEKLFEMNRSTSSDLAGGAYCASIERSEEGEPWVQLKNGVVNVFYPFDDDPLERLQSKVTSRPQAVNCMDWEAWKFATFEFTPQSPGEAAAFVEDLFTAFYGFESDTEVTVEIFDMRVG